MAGVLVKVRDELAVRADAREGRRLVAERKFEEAYAPLERWLKARPNSAEALFLTARGMFAANLIDQGFIALERARSQGYPPQEIERQEAIILSHLARHNEAEPVLRRLLLSSSKPDPEADEALAKCYLETFQLARAESVIEKWIRDAPDDAKPYLWKLELARKVKAESSVLIEIIQRVLQLDPNSDQAHLALAEVYLQNHRLDEAAREYAAHLKLKPDTSPAHLGLGIIAMERGDEEVAIRNLDRAQRLDPRDVRPLLERGKLEVGRGRFELGLAFMDQATRFDAGEPEVHYQRSLVLTRLGRTALAKAERDTSARLREEREHIQKLLTEMLVAPGDLDHQFDAARWLFEHGHPEEGLRWTEKILRDQPRHAKTNLLLADYYEKKGSPGLANFYRLQAKSEP
jgi:tetratricopeptide (TPR) repeat protein